MDSIEAFYQVLDLPDATKLETKIPKKLFKNNVELSSQDKKAFEKDVKLMTWRNTLKPNTINIAAYSQNTSENFPEKKQNENDEKEHSSSKKIDHFIEYLEIAVIEVILKNDKRYKRIAEIIQRAMPYPMLIVFIFSEQNISNKSEVKTETLTETQSELELQKLSIALNLATKRVSKSDPSKLKVERFYNTDWLLLNELDDMAETFLNSLSVSKQPLINFYEFYLGWVNQFIKLETARHIGTFNTKNNIRDIVETNKTSLILDQIASLESHLQTITNNIKKEYQINRKVEMNIHAQQLKQELAELKSKLK